MKRILLFLPALLLCLSGCTAAASGSVLPEAQQSMPTDATDARSLELTGDSAWDKIAAYAETHNRSVDEWPEYMVALLERNPETLDFVLEYPEKYGAAREVDLSDYGDCSGVPLFLQWDSRWGYLDYSTSVAGITACGPVCLSMVAWYYFRSDDVAPDRIIRFALEGDYCVPGNGTAWTLISQGGEELGLDVEELPLDKDVVFSHLEAGEPVICIMGPGDFTDSGHYIVLTGVENGLLRVNDPNSRRKSEKLWDFDAISAQIDNLWAISTPED